MYMIEEFKLIENDAKKFSQLKEAFSEFMARATKTIENTKTMDKIFLRSSEIKKIMEVLRD